MNELECGRFGDQGLGLGPAEETADGFAALLAVIEGPMIDIHPDKLVGEVASHVPGVGEGVLHGFGPVVEAVANAGGEEVGDGLAGGGVEALMDDIAAEGKGESVVFLSPPDPEVLAEGESLVAVGELAFVDDESDLGLAFTESAENLVEGDDDDVEVAGGALEPELEGEEGAGQRAGDGDFEVGDSIPVVGLGGDEHGAVAVAHAGAAGEEGIVFADVGVGVDADGGDIEFAAGGAFVEGLDILEDVLEAEAVGGDEVLGEGVEHEGVVGVGGMT